MSTLEQHRAAVSRLKANPADAACGCAPRFAREGMKRAHRLWPCACC